MDNVPCQPCWLVALPQELLFGMIDYIDRKRDLYNLSRTCRALEDVCLRRLYARVDVEISKDKASSWTTGSLLAVRPHVVHVMKELVIRNGSLDQSKPIYNRRHASDAGTVEAYATDILEWVPVNQLRALSFLHTAPMSSRVLGVLATNHCQSLRELAAYDLGCLASQSLNLPNKLTALECHSMQDGRILENLVSINRSSLERLRIGQEKELVQQYSQTRVGFLAQAPQSATLFRSMSLGTLPSLRQLDLCGVDVSPLVPLEVEDALFFCELTRISLESCPGSVQLLHCLANTFNFARDSPLASNPQPIVQLKDFLFRSESPTTQVKEALLLFLDSFTGLRTLSLLLENASVLERVSTILCQQGPTLETLVLESRIQPRDNLGLDTSRPFGSGGYSQELWEQAINDICQLCPNLVELGMGFPWDDEVVRLRKTRLPTLPFLKTIHIRNFPENHALSQVGDYTIKEYATKFVDWVFPTLVGGSKPALETLAIGPTVYEGRWKTGSSRRQPAEFQRTHFFGIDWGLTRFRRWNFMVSPVSEKYMEELRGQKPLTGVFEQVWLK
ncbi:uncharacterized protein HMPREF1541_00481 [Cyphellophora europaea CBS 101466]|uniref:F-box domain-containing protein n=1 Tax=Cyphellophora europaea (strain CBS 101466) TaxID=1220924 RepID=W2SC67_CYPE1|nr:uncharacterized protein HMPREF1541_00481 [Cyphellophora europaea CBS 101466]ETN46297.1 hypothetical protein HMPREF1541_00481 [Cyphellophora europaea CBS 101466]